MGFKAVIVRGKAAVGAVLLVGMLASMAGCTMQVTPTNPQTDVQVAPPADGAWDSPVASDILSNPADPPADGPTLHPQMNPSGLPAAGYTPEQLIEYVEEGLTAPEHYVAEFGLDMGVFTGFWLIHDTCEYMLRTGKPMVEVQSAEITGTATYLIPAEEVKKMALYQYGNDNIDLSLMDGYDPQQGGFEHVCAHDRKPGVGNRQELRTYYDISQGQIEVVVDYYRLESTAGIPDTWVGSKKCLLQPVDMEGELLFMLLYSGPEDAA